MSTSPTQRLHELGVALPSPTPPVADYVGAKRSGNLLFVSGHVSPVRGEVGSEVSVEAARDGARAAVLDALGTAAVVVGGLDRIASIEKLNGYVRSASDFVGQPEVINGASALLKAIFGDAGEHARAAVGVVQLPLGAAVEVELVVRLHAGAEDGR